ncbi:hypothetical protein [Salmonirosea aquatica]
MNNLTTQVNLIGVAAAYFTWKYGKAAKWKYPAVGAAIAYLLMTKLVK